MSLRRAAIVSLAALAGACGGERPAPSAAPAPSSSPARGGLRPLTSRDGAPEPTPGPPQGLPPGHPPIGGAEPASDARKQVSGTLTVAPSLASRAASARALFLVARDSASQQIVAVRKEDDVRFPLRFSISGADAMTEGTAFTGPFDLTARLSKSGDAIPGVGDIEGQAKGVEAGKSDVAITLDRVRQ